MDHHRREQLGFPQRARQTAAVAHLTQKIRKGGSGVGGPIPMPPQSGPSEEELATLIHWVLKQPAKQ